MIKLKNNGNLLISALIVLAVAIFLIAASQTPLLGNAPFTSPLSGSGLQPINLNQQTPSSALENILAKTASQLLPEIEEQQNRNIEKIKQILDTGSPIQLTGYFEIMHSDNFDGEKQADYEYYLITDNGIRYTLYSIAGLPHKSTPNVDIRGIRVRNEIVVTSFTTNGAAQRGNPVLGEQNVVVLLVNFQDNPTQPITIEEVRTFLFSENPNSTNSFYREVSYNKTSITGDVFGWYTLPLNSSACDEYVLPALAIEAADPDVYFPNYSNVLILVPYTSSCPFGARATIGRVPIFTNEGTVFVGLSFYNGRGVLGAAAHELGHNFGMWHAAYWYCGNESIGEWGTDCQSIGYGDIFDTMAMGNGHFNAIRKEFLGWFSNENVVEAGNHGIYYLTPLETSGNSPKTIKIPTASGLTYHVEFRQAIGLDSHYADRFGKKVFEGAFIRFGFLDEPLGDTQLVDMSPEGSLEWTNTVYTVLGQGETFFDPENDVVITVLGITPQRLTLYYGLAFCGNGKIDPGEECDGINLGGKSCQDLMYRRGTLACNSSCQFETSKCQSQVCGEGHARIGENQCEATFKALPEGAALVGTGTDWNSTRHHANVHFDPSSPPGPIQFYPLPFSLVYYPSPLSSTIPRIPVLFDTRSIPDNAIIESTRLSLWRYNNLILNSHPASEDFLTTVQIKPTNPPQISRQDYENFGSVDNPTEITERIDLSEVTTPSIGFLFQQKGLSTINKTSYSTFGLRGGYDLQANPNNGSLTRLGITFIGGFWPFKKPTLTVRYFTPLQEIGPTPVPHPKSFPFRFFSFERQIHYKLASPYTHPLQNEN